MEYSLNNDKSIVLFMMNNFNVSELTEFLDEVLTPEMMDKFPECLLDHIPAALVHIKKFFRVHFVMHEILSEGEQSIVFRVPLGGLLLKIVD